MTGIGTQKSKIGKILGVAGTAAAMVLLALAVAVAAITFTAKAKGETPTLFGRAFHLVVSGSMEPEIAVGELVVSKKIAFEEIRPGDNIVFLCVDPASAVYGKEVIHKAIRRTEAGIVTRGVANSEEDALPVTAENLRGVAVAQSVFWGSVLTFLANPLNWLFLALMAALAWVVARLSGSIVRQVGEVRGERAAATRAEIEAELRAQYGLPERGSGEDAPDDGKDPEADASREPTARGESEEGPWDRRRPD